MKLNVFATPCQWLHMSTGCDSSSTFLNNTYRNEEKISKEKKKEKKTDRKSLVINNIMFVLHKYVVVFNTPLMFDRVIIL